MITRITLLYTIQLGILNTKNQNFQFSKYLMEKGSSVSSVQLCKMDIYISGKQEVRNNVQNEYFIFFVLSS